MEMFRHLVVMSILLLVPTMTHAADVTVVDVTYETCTEGTAAIVKGEACHVQDIVKGSSKWEITMKFGLFVEYTAAAGAGTGASASTAFVVKMSIPLNRAKSADEVRAYVQKNPEEVAKKIMAALKPKATRPPAEKDILRLIKSPGKPFCSLEDDDFEEMLKKNSCSLDD
ncbi:hypothetical protein ACN28S_07895 [Cystobacter fuscus]